MSTCLDTPAIDRSGAGPVRAATARDRIVAILPRGEAIRNFVYTGALELVGKSADLSVLTVFPNDEIRELMWKKYERVIELQEIPERRLVGTVRDLLDMAHGRRLWSKAAQERWRLRDLEADTMSAMVKRRVKKLLCRSLATRPGVTLVSRIERSLARRLRTNEEYLRLFRDLRPSLVFNASHIHSPLAIQVVQAAEWLGIPTAAFIFSWDNLTSQGRVIPMYDHYLVWNHEIGDQLVRIYPSVRHEQIHVTGTPQFDLHLRPEYHWTREEFCRRVGADPARPIVLYTTGMAHHMPDEPQIVEGIADMVRQMPDLGSPQVMVRVYPKDRTGRFEDVKRRRPEVLFPHVPWESEHLTPRPEDSYLLANMLKHAAVGINLASTVSLELCIFDKPVINVCYTPCGASPGTWDARRYYDFEHYRPVVESGAVALVTSESEMAEAIRRAISCPEEHGTQRRNLLSRMFGPTLDGRSAERVAAALINLAGPGRRDGA